MNQIKKNSVLILTIQPQSDEPVVENTIKIIFGEITPNTIPIMKSLIKTMHASKVDQKQRDKLQYQDKQQVCFKIGLDKIQQVTISINQMEATLKEEEILLNEATKKTNQLLAKLEQQQKKLTEQEEEEVAACSKLCESQAEQIFRERKQKELELEPVIPALRRIQDAVDSIEIKDIVELKSGKRPLEIIKYVIDSVAVLFKAKLIPIQIEERVFNKREGKVVMFLKESYDESGVQILGDINFMKKLKTYEKEQINEEMIELLEPYLSQSEDWFNNFYATKASKASADILKWIMGISEFYQTWRKVLPKIKQLRTAEEKLELFKKLSQKTREELASIQDNIKNLKEELLKQMEEKNQLEMKAAKTKKVINTARTLITSLSVENERYGKNPSDTKCILLVDNVPLQAATISNSGPFDVEFCNKLAQQNSFGGSQELGVLSTQGLELTNLVIDTANGGQNDQILTKDDISVQNDINCFSLVIENLDEPMADPVFDHQVILKGKTAFDNFEGAQMGLAKEFCHVMIYRLADPSFQSELSGETTIIDSSSIQSGLDNQLLGQDISKNQQSLEVAQNQLSSDLNQDEKDYNLIDKNMSQYD